MLALIEPMRRESTRGKPAQGSLALVGLRLPRPV